MLHIIFDYLSEINKIKFFVKSNAHIKYSCIIFKVNDKVQGIL